MGTIETPEQALSRLDGLERALDGIRTEKRINIFTAAGLTRQEVKHSSFLAWLLDRSKPHKMGSEFLKRVTEGLFVQKPNILKPGEKDNREILSAIGIYSPRELDDFFNDENYKVYTELPTRFADESGRMDIVVESTRTKTALIIENKTFTATHDCQLYKYEKHYAASDFERKIFVYLTPEGVMPYDNGDGISEYRPNWCVLSYQTVVEIVERFLSEKAIRDKKLKMIMEDYIEMINANLLSKDKRIAEKCREIKKKYADALEILMAYTDNAEAVVNICKKWLANAFPAVGYVNDRAEKSFEIDTQTLDFVNKFFCEEYGEEIDAGGYLKCRIGVGGADGPVVIKLSLQKEREGGWSKAQRALIERFKQKRVGDMYCSLYGEELLSEQERDVSADNARLEELVTDKLKKFFDGVREKFAEG